MSERPIYLFVHIPKTAGGVVRKHLRKSLRNRFATIEARAEKQAPLTADRLSKCDLLAGHGISRLSARQYCPGREERFCTILREPAALVVSQYNWHVHVCRTEKHIEPPGFDEWFIPSRRSLCARWIVRVFLQSQATNDQDALYREARDALRSFWLVGNTEQLNSSIAPLFKALGVPDPITDATHVTGRDLKATVQRTPELDAYIRERSPADMALYQEFCGAQSAVVA